VYFAVEKEFEWEHGQIVQIIKDILDERESLDNNKLENFKVIFHSRSSFQMS